MKQQSAQICWEKDKSLDDRGPIISGAIIIASAWSRFSDKLSNHSLNCVSAAFLRINTTFNRCNTTCIYNLSVAASSQYQRLSPKNPFKSGNLLRLLTFKDSERELNYPSTLPLLCVLIRWPSGKPPATSTNPLLPWCSFSCLTDVVISHWNLNQTINTQQLSCSKKRCCLHNSARQDAFAWAHWGWQVSIVRHY